MNVLVYTRPRIKVFFHHLAEKISSFENIIYISDHKGLEPNWIMEYYYKAKEDIELSGFIHETSIDVERVIIRCRYLRTLNKDIAKVKVKAMILAVERIIEKFNIDVVFGMVMDSYILDIFDLVMRDKNSQYVGFINNMVNGYSRLTSRGELIQLSNVLEEDVDKVLSNLSQVDYVPNMQNDFMWNTSPFSMFFTKYLKEKIKIAYYFFKKIYDKDPDNFYYNTVASKDCMSCRRIGQIFFRRHQDSNWLDKVRDAKKHKKVIVYLPLQFYPECSLDYWGTNSQFSDFYSVIKKLLSNNYNDILILAKEHPSAMGLRKESFYKQFSENENVLLVPFDVPSNSVVENAKVVLTWTGSVGVEAIMRDKYLVSFGEAYYDPGTGITKLEKIDQLDGIEQIILGVVKEDSSSLVSLKKEVVRYMLKGLISGYVFPLDYKDSIENEMEISKLAEGIDEYIIKLQAIGSYEVKSGCI